MTFEFFFKKLKFFILIFFILFNHFNLLILKINLLIYFQTKHTLKHKLSHIKKPFIQTGFLAYNINCVQCTIHVLLSLETGKFYQYVCLMSRIDQVHCASTSHGLMLGYLVWTQQSTPVKHTSFVAQFVDCFWCTDEVLEVFEVAVFSTWSIQFAIFSAISYIMCLLSNACVIFRRIYTFFSSSLPYHHDLKTRVVFCRFAYANMCLNQRIRWNSSSSSSCFLYFCIIYFDYIMSCSSSNHFNVLCDSPVDMGHSKLRGWKGFNLLITVKPFALTHLTN
jgi:hypothetical protein